ncbi:MAG: hypothetical protein IPK80_01930 [Nannocystis sp.]|nr:hypothetical protein [Nannocystis sp.]
MTAQLLDTGAVLSLTHFALEPEYLGLELGFFDIILRVGLARVGFSSRSATSGIVLWRCCSR